MPGIPAKILIIKPSALGDVIQALPVACGLKKRQPSTIIHWVVNEGYEELLAGHPCVDKIITYPRKRWTGIFALPEILRWSKQLQQEQYDMVIDLQGLARSGLMTRASGAERRLGLKSAREGARLAYNEIIHDYPLAACERYLCALSHLGITGQPDDFQLKASAPLPPQLEGKKYVVFHPYSRWETKLWPWRNYRELALQMPQQTCVVVGEGPWFPLPGQNVIDLRGKLSIGKLMAVLQNAQLVLSTDSGPAHLAAALGTPTVVLFGATDSRKTAPAGKNVVVQKRSIPCAPCLRRTCFNPEQLACLVGIPTTTIRQKIEEVSTSSY